MFLNGSTSHGLLHHPNKTTTLHWSSMSRTSSATTTRVPTHRHSNNIFWSFDALITKQLAAKLKPSSSFALCQITMTDIVIRNVALLRRNALSGAFERAFTAQAQANEENDQNFDPNAIEFMRIDPHRDERMYIRHHRDYTTLIIGIALDDLDEADKLFVKLTFEELKHRSRLQSYCARAPLIVHTKVSVPPSEIAHLGEVVQDSSHYRAYIPFCMSCCYPFLLDSV